MPNQTDQQSSSFLQSETDEQLVNAAVKLPRDMTPERDLWPELHARLIQKPARAPLNVLHYGIAASVILLAVLVGWISRESTLNIPQTIQEPQLTKTQDTNELSALVQQLAKSHQSQIIALIEAKSLTAINGMQLTALDGAQGQLQPSFANQHTLIEALKEIRVSADLTQKQLSQQPNNQQLWQLWLWLLEKEIDLIKQIPTPEYNPILQSNDHI